MSIDKLKIVSEKTFIPLSFEKVKTHNDDVVDDDDVIVTTKWWGRKKNGKKENSIPVKIPCQKHLFFTNFTSFLSPLSMFTWGKPLIDELKIRSTSCSRLYSRSSLRKGKHLFHLRIILKRKMKISFHIHLLLLAQPYFHSLLSSTNKDNEFTNCLEKHFHLLITIIIISMIIWITISRLIQAKIV